MKPFAPRLHAAPRWLFWLLLLSGALLLGLCILFPVLGVLEWVAAVPSGLAILTAARDRSIRLRRMYGYGFCFFGCFYLVNFHWFLYMYPLTFAGLSDAASAVVVIVAWFGLSALQTVGAAALFPLFAVAVRGKIPVRQADPAAVAVRRPVGSAGMDSGKHRVGRCTVGKTAARAGRAPPDSAECRLSRLLFRLLPADRGEYADCRPAPAPGSGAAVRHSGGQSAGREPRTRRSAPADPPGGGQCGTGRRDPGQYVLVGKMVRQFRFRRALRDADAKGGGRGSYADRLAGNGTDCHDRPFRRCPRPAEPARTRKPAQPCW
ncbi:MAG: hypothetical protein L6V84_01670 [Oscillospiraceae bacterium]|nr:MAG: hypothetical protein L6V84_01670 [Oscillospiraceae bacterium]